MGRNALAYSILLALLLVPLSSGISNVQHSIDGTVLTLTYDGTPPFRINVRNEPGVGEARGYVHTHTSENQYSIDLGFAYNPSGVFYYGVKDAEWSQPQEFSLGGSEGVELTFDDADEISVVRWKTDTGTGAVAGSAQFLDANTLEVVVNPGEEDAQLWLEFDETLVGVEYVQFEVEAAIGTTTPVFLHQHDDLRARTRGTMSSLREDWTEYHFILQDFKPWAQATEFVDLGQTRLVRIDLDLVEEGFFDATDEEARTVRFRNLRLSDTSSKIEEAAQAGPVTVSVNVEQQLGQMVRPWEDVTAIANNNKGDLLRSWGIKDSRTSAWHINKWEVVNNTIRGVGDYDFSVVDSTYRNKGPGEEHYAWIPSIPYFLWQVQDPDVKTPNGIRALYAHMPPTDYAAWETVVKDFVQYHIDQGYNIVGYSVLNEANGENFWAGTDEEAFEFYAITAKAVKEVDPTLRVAGPSMAGFTPQYMTRFIEYAAVNDAPLDDFAWHGYIKGRPAQFGDQATIAQRILDDFPQYAGAELINNEWGYGLQVSYEDRNQRAIAAAAFADSFKEHVDTNVGTAYMYKPFAQDSRELNGQYWGTGMWDFDGQTARPTLYVYDFFNRIGEEQLSASVDADIGIDTLASTDENGTIHVLLWWHIPGTGFESVANDVTIDLQGLSGSYTYEQYMIDSTNNIMVDGQDYVVPTPVDTGVVSGPTDSLEFSLELYGTALITLTPT